MSFNSLVFLVYFLPLVLILYALLWKISKNNNLILNIYLSIASLIFYLWGARQDDYKVLLALIIVNFIIGQIIKHKKDRLIFAFGIIFNVSVLTFFKYPQQILRGLSINYNEEILFFPLAISFIIFHCISFLVDVYKEDNHKPSNLLTDLVDFSLYILFFPKLIQGPIVKYKDFLPQINNRAFTSDRILMGIERFIIGLGKKVLLADELSIMITRINQAGPIDTQTGWLSVLYYAIQLYLDFSAYSDMALGIGKIFGFDFKENFNFPYLSTSISEFWRRWHISLGAWFREYVYFPLGGSRTGNVYVNLFVVFLLTGLWHGNTLIYLLWGVAHGIVVLLERTPAFNKIKESIPKSNIFGWLYTTFIVIIGWLCFRLPTVRSFFEYLSLLLGNMPEGISLTWQYFINEKILFIIAIFILGNLILSRRKIQESYIELSQESITFKFVKYLVLTILYVLCFIGIVNNGFSPFLYFQF